MNQLISEKRLLRPVIRIVLFLSITLLVTQYALSHGKGETGHTNKPGDTPGCSCHCNSANAATTAIISTSQTSFQPGQSYTFTITVDNPTESAAGCDIAVSRGSLSAGSDGLKKSGSQLTHSSRKDLPAVWTFTYTAPSTPGFDTIYAVGNAVNSDGCSD